MKYRKHLSFLLIILLVFSLTSQAVSAYVMSCRDTATCCCTGMAASMNMTGPMSGGMEQNCCTTAPSDPCDIETVPNAAAEPFLSGFGHGSGNDDVTAGLTAFIIDSGDNTLHMARQAEHFADRGGPPIYLQIQSFLC